MVFQSSIPADCRLRSGTRPDSGRRQFLRGAGRRKGSRVF
ncbi:MAG: phage DNA packaging protein J [Chloroflexi bacterium]|nr:phage DNA packaging protein J [Chloroflexota bacterium]